ncbi:unnamed protein product, partial [Acanthoscelides obtectus]
EELGVRELVSRWIPHLLTEEQKAARVNWCQKTLDRFNPETQKMCTALLEVTNRGFTVMNQKINDSRLFGCSKVKKSQQQSSVLEVFRKRWSRHLCQKQKFLLMNKELLLQIGIPPFVCQVITEHRKINPERRIILHQENVELLDHPPYSPDLSPNDFFTFPKIKNRLRGQRFQSPEEAVDAFKNAVLDLPANEWN